MQEFYNEKEIIVDTRVNYKHLQLNRPNVLNSLKREQFLTIRDLFFQYEKDKQTDFVIVSGVGRAFCAGGDLVQITNGVKYKVEEADQFVWNEYRMDRDLHYFSKPYIALMHGIVMGGGAGLAMPARYKICTEKTIFAMPENSIGFYVDVGVTWYLSRIPNNVGMFIAMTGYRCNTLDCLFTGIGTHYVPSKDIPAFLEDMEGVKDVVTHLKKYDGSNVKIDKMQSGIKNNIDSVENIIQRLERENTTFSKECLEAMNGSSPTSLYATFKMMKKAKNCTIDQLLILNFSLSTNLFRKSYDFVEGVRAKIVEKDNAPNWKPKQVDKKFMDSLFESDQILHFSRL
jgi:enoyl-CoA hydratase